MKRNSTRRKAAGALLRSLVCAVSLWSFANVSDAAEADTFSLIVSYQYQNALDEPGSGTTITSPVVSYQYFEWPGDENLTFQNSPSVSYLYEGAPQIVSQPLGLSKRLGETAVFQVSAQGSTPLSYQWRINGVNINGATGSTYTLANLQAVHAGNYSVVVRNAYGVVASTDGGLNVLVTSNLPLPAVPALVPTQEGLPISLTAKPRVPTSAQLKSFGSKALVDPSKMTIVITHGWNATAFEWPLEMANELKSIYDCNIVVWDWHENALINPLDPAPSANQAVAEGRALGKALMDTLEPTYNQPIHFIGHSLGTIVNCAAADYLHDSTKRPRGETRPASEVYASSRTHMTLLDQAEVVTAVKGLHVAWDLVLSTSPFLSGLALSDARSSLTNFGSKVIPDNARFIDNYVSLVGLGQSKAVNVMLWRNALTINQVPLHGYAITWYRYTITYPRISFLGHKWSFERNTINSTGASTGLPKPNSYYLQNDAATGGEYGFTDVIENASDFGIEKTLLYPSYITYKGVNAAAKTVGSAATVVKNGTIKYVGNVKAGFEVLYAPLSEAVANAATKDSAYHAVTTATEGLVYRSFPDLQLSIEPGNGQRMNVQMNAQAMNQSSNTTEANSIYSKIPVHVPREAVGFTFEYMVEDGAVEDYVTIGINTENKLTTEVKHLVDGDWNSTPMMNITDYIDQDVELVFALNGKDTPAMGRLSVRNIQFYIPERPQLEISLSSDTAVASWPISAIDWNLETTTDLTQPNWQPVEGAPDDTNYFHTVTFDLGIAKKGFFRLRK